MSEHLPTEESELSKGFNCTKCQKHHRFSSYVFAHWDMMLTHSCDCGAVHHVRQGVVTPTEQKHVYRD